MGMLRLSTLVRTIVAEASVYLLAMLAARIYMQLSLAFTDVQFLSHFSLYLVIVNQKYFRAPRHNLRSCEYSINLNDRNLQLTSSTPLMKCIWTVRVPCPNLSWRGVKLTYFSGSTPY